MLSITYQFDKY